MDNASTNGPTEDTQAPFNAAISTLQRLDRILESMTEISKLVGKEFGPAQGQYRKHRLCKDYMVQAMPLIREQEDKDKIQKEFYKIKLTTKKYYDIIRPAYSAEVELAIDNVIILIENCLQKSGFFMPTREESGL